MMRFGSVSETRTVSSMNPVCFFRIGRTFSWIAFASSLAFPDLALISTTRVNIGCSLHWLEGERNLRRRARRRTVFVCTKHATPLRLMGQLPGIGAETRLPQVDNAAVFSVYRITNSAWLCLPLQLEGQDLKRLLTPTLQHVFRGNWTCSFVRRSSVHGAVKLRVWH
jgi:hypothetical protein